MEDGSDCGSPTLSFPTLKAGVQDWLKERESRLGKRADQRSVERIRPLLWRDFRLEFYRDGFA